MINKLDSISEHLDAQSTTFDFDERINQIEQPSERLDENSIDFDKRINVETSDEADVITYEEFTLDDCLRLFDEDIYDELTIEEKAFVIDLLCEYITNELGIINKPFVGYYEDEDLSNYGGYSPEHNVIALNIYHLNDGREVRDTVIHECRHCWQHERSNLPEDLQDNMDKLFKENFENYISPEDNYRQYLEQPVEKNARMYADFIENGKGVYEHE